MATAKQSEEDLEERRILIIGKTGHGKSATANTLLGKPVCRTSVYGQSETEKCQYQFSIRFGKKLVVVDTPGIFDTKRSDDDIRNELIRSCALLSPGPHAILMVYKTGERYTEENEEAARKYFKLFRHEDEVSNYMFLILSHWDQAPKKESPETYIKKSGDKLIELRAKCKAGCYVFKNKLKNKDACTEKLLKGIDDNLKEMNNKHLTSPIFKGIEVCLYIDEAISKTSSRNSTLDSLPQSEEGIEIVTASEEFIESRPTSLLGRDNIRRRVADEDVKNSGIFARIVAWIRRLFAPFL